MNKKLKVFVFIIVVLACSPIAIFFSKKIVDKMIIREYQPFVKSAWFTNTYHKGIETQYKYVTFFGKVKLWDIKTNKQLPQEVYITGVKYE